MVNAAMKQLDDLIHEVIEFSNLIAYSENPADPDLQNACRLFRDYLSAQLRMLHRSMIGLPSAMHSRWTVAELQQLSDLIDQDQPDLSSCSTDWIRALFQYCISLQRGGLAAA